MSTKRIAVEIDGKFVRFSSKTYRKRLVKDLNDATIFVSKSAAKSWIDKETQKKCNFLEVILKPFLKQENLGCKCGGLKVTDGDGFECCNKCKKIIA